MHNRVDCCCSGYENAVRFEARPLQTFEGGSRKAERGEKGEKEKEKEEEARILFLHKSCIYIAHNRTFCSASSISVSDQRLTAHEQ